MICAFCKQNSEQIAWDETSHLGTRPICYACIGKRDLLKMKRTGSIILYKENDRLHNMVRTLSIRITDTIVKDNYTLLTFSFRKRQWQGTTYNDCNQVWCRKVR